MKAKDVMTTKVVAVASDTPVDSIAALLLKRRISAVPVIDEDRRILGIVSEGDLMRRSKVTRRRPWWLVTFRDAEILAREFVKTHGLYAEDVMTPQVVTVTEETPIATIAELLEEKGIKRVPVVRDGRLVGIVSRADLLRGLATRGLKVSASEVPDDRAIQAHLVAVLEREPWADTTFLSVTVDHGVVHLWGLVRSEDERKALCLAAETVPGVRTVRPYVRLLSEATPSA